VTEALKDHLEHHASTYEIHSILEHRKHKGNHEFKVRWLGFSTEESTWQSIDTLMEDVPYLLYEYVKEHEGEFPALVLAQVTEAMNIKEH
jgi:hypothetical protein